MQNNPARKLDAQRANPYAAPTGAAAPAVRTRAQAAELASPGTRLLAYILDALMFGLASAPGAIAGVLSADPAEFQVRTSQGHVVPPASVLGLGLMTALLFYLCQCILIARTGQSLGKRLCRIRIVDAYGDPPGAFRGVVLRSWLMVVLGIIPLLGACLSLLDTLLIFGAERRCVHDRLAGTLVVND